jgi:hypothetical protein
MLRVIRHGAGCLIVGEAEQAERCVRCAAAARADG